MYTSFGKLTDKVYRLHITCPAKHMTYLDYATKRAAKINLAKMTDKTTWYATHIEIIGEYKKMNGDYKHKHTCLRCRHVSLWSYDYTILKNTAKCPKCGKRSPIVISTEPNTSELVSRYRSK